MLYFLFCAKHHGSRIISNYESHLFLLILLMKIKRGKKKIKQKNGSSNGVEKLFIVIDQPLSLSSN